MPLFRSVGAQNSTNIGRWTYADLAHTGTITGSSSYQRAEILWSDLRYRAAALRVSDATTNSSGSGPLDDQDRIPCTTQQVSANWYRVIGEQAQDSPSFDPQTGNGSSCSSWRAPTDFRIPCWDDNAWTTPKPPSGFARNIDVEPALIGAQASSSTLCISIRERYDQAFHSQISDGELADLAETGQDATYYPISYLSPAPLND